MKVKLKPCPFCGSTYVYKDFGTRQSEEGLEIIWEVYCNNCDASIKNEDADKAIEAWNRRVHDTKEVIHL